jgi:hypothetical protein
MKKLFLMAALTMLTAATGINATTLTTNGGGHKPKKAKAAKTAKPVKVAEAEEESYIKAIRLYNLPDGTCTFEEGRIPNKTNMDVKTFFAQTHVDDYEKVAHAAPRMQYVVTLKGKLKFKVSNGDTFIIEPGVVLIAEDTLGKGHSWDLVKCDKWERLYIPLKDGAEDHFIKK